MKINLKNSIIIFLLVYSIGLTLYMFANRNKEVINITEKEIEYNNSIDSLNIEIDNSYEIIDSLKNNMVVNDTTIVNIIKKYEESIIDINNSNTNSNIEFFSNYIKDFRSV